MTESENRTAVSPFFLRHAGLLREAARLGPVLDLACGRGRHALASAERGWPTLGLDRSASALRSLQSVASRRGLKLVTARCDLETGSGIPVRPGSCGAILVFRFLYRPLATAILQALHPGGVLLYETFTERQIELGRRPSNPDFLLRCGELPELFPELAHLEYGEEISSDPHPEALAHLAARARLG